MKTCPKTGWRKVRAVVDSGASDSCAPPALAPEVAVVESPGSKAGQTWNAAGKGSEPIENQGQKVLGMVTEAGSMVKGTWQVADICRPLLSVKQVTRQDNRVTFGVGGGEIQSLTTGEITKVGVEGDIYVFDFWLPPERQPFKEAWPRG